MRREGLCNLGGLFNSVPVDSKGRKDFPFRKKEKGTVMILAGCNLELKQNNTTGLEKRIMFGVPGGYQAAGRVNRRP